MKLTRRALTKSIGAAALPGALIAHAQAQSQAQPPAAAAETEETLSARTTLRANLDQLAKVKIPREIEPATTFSAK